MAPQPDGKTLREHLFAVWKATRRRPPELDLPPLPAAGVAVWEWFKALDAARGSNGWGPNPISWADLVAWQQLAGVQLTPWEAETLRALDRERMTQLNRKE